MYSHLIGLFDAPDTDFDDPLLNERWIPSLVLVPDDLKENENQIQDLTLKIQFQFQSNLSVEKPQLHLKQVLFGKNHLTVL